MKAINRHDVLIYRPFGDIGEEAFLAKNVRWSLAVEIAEAARKALRFCSMHGPVLVLIAATAKTEAE